MNHNLKEGKEREEKMSTRGKTGPKEWKEKKNRGNQVVGKEKGRNEMRKSEERGQRRKKTGKEAKRE